MREPDAEALDPVPDFIYVFDEAEFVVVRAEPWPAGPTDGEPN